MHRDIKPCNLLVNVNCDLKICDFGLARGISDPTLAPFSEQDEAFQEQLTMYVVTRWYRAPEVILSQSEYDEGIDLWAVGCVFAELIGRQPLFTGKNHLHQIQIIQQVLGKLSEEDLSHFDAQVRSFLLNTELKHNITERPSDKSDKDIWKTKFPQANELALDLLSKLLTFNPKKRITVRDAISHEYFREIT
jgi:serine/threonine protein kinase